MSGGGHVLGVLSGYTRGVCVWGGRRSRRVIFVVFSCLQAYASQEVILSGGAINSPQLLMLSGVGNADDLKKLGLSVVCHLPGEPRARLC